MAETHFQKNDDKNQCSHCGKTYQYYQYLILHLKGCPSRSQTLNMNEKIRDKQGDGGSNHAYESDDDNISGENEEEKGSISDNEKSSTNELCQRQDFIELSSDDDDESSDNESNATSFGTNALSTATYDSEPVQLENYTKAYCEEAYAMGGTVELELEPELKDDQSTLNFSNNQPKEDGNREVGDNEVLEKSADYSDGLCDIADRVPAVDTPNQATMGSFDIQNSQSTKRGKVRKKKKHSCSICHKQLSSQSSLSRHSLVHTAIRGHECPVCARKFKRKDDMQRHARTRHGLHLTTPLTKKTYKAKVPVQKSGKSIEGKDTYQDTNLQDEVLVNPQDLHDDEEDENEEGEIEEEVDDLYEAECAAEDEEDESYSEFSYCPLNKDILMEECDEDEGKREECGAAVSHIEKETEENEVVGNLEAIIVDKEEHQEEGQKQGKVNEVDVEEYNEKMLEEIENTNAFPNLKGEQNQDTPFIPIMESSHLEDPCKQLEDANKCKLCSKSFSCHKDMLRHMKDKVCSKTSKPSRNNEKLFVCTECGQSFMSEISLKRHISLHTGQRPHPCLVCGRKFLYKSDLRKHTHKKKVKEKHVKHPKLFEKNDRLQQNGEIPENIRIENDINNRIDEDDDDETEELMNIQAVLITQASQDSESKVEEELTPSAVTNVPENVTLSLNASCTSSSCADRENVDTNNVGNIFPPLVRDEEECHKKQNIMKVEDKIREFVCSSCNKRFSSARGLKEHAVLHSGNKNFQCDICMKKFFTNDMRSKHMRNIHQGLPYECSSCHKQFAYSFELKTHSCLLSDKKKNVTPRKQKSGKQPQVNDDEMRKHEVSQTANRSESKKERGKQERGKLVDPPLEQHVCPICHKELSTRQSLIKHMRIHYQAEQHQCNNCMKRFVYAHSLRRHLKLKVCGKSDAGTNRKVFSRKRKIATETTKKDIKKAAKTKVLKSDMRLSKLPAKNEVPIKRIRKIRIEKRFKCDICLKSYAHNESLIRHSKLHKTASNNKAPRNKACIIENQAENRDFEDRDRRKEKARKSDAIYECSTCKKKFSRRTHLERHQLLHLNIRHFKCSECPKKFTRKDSLKGHVRNIHSNNVKDQCKDKRKVKIPKKKKIFSKKIKTGNSHNENEQKMIMRNKLNEKSCKDNCIPDKHLTCDICNKQFSGKDRKQYFRIHVIQNHTGIKSFKCNHCPTRFSCSRYVKAHMKRVHGNASSV